MPRIFLPLFALGLMLAVLVGGGRESFALPMCPNSPLTGTTSDVRSWNNCRGTLIEESSSKFAGVKYVGDFKNGKKHGQGTLTAVPPSKFAGLKHVGEWKNGLQHGPSILTLGPPNKYAGEKYVGVWKNALQQGHGTQTFYPPSKFAGQKYVGGYKNGKRHGQGILTYDSPHKSAGRKYVGEFRNDKKHGQGTLTFDAPSKFAGEKYVGEYREGVKHGKGTHTYDSPHKYAGQKYVGDFRNGKPNGQGTDTHNPPSKSAGRKYVGEFRDGKMHGQGILTFDSPHRYAGRKYVGEFRADKMHGQGTFIYPRGSKARFCCKYVGEWKNNKPDGPGIHTLADGTIEEGMYRNGYFQFAAKVSPDRIARNSSPRFTKPTLPKVNQQKRLELSRRTQEALLVLGLYSGKLDGIIGVRTRSAVQRWQKRNGFLPTGEIIETQLSKLEKEAVTRLAEKEVKPGSPQSKNKPKPKRWSSSSGSGFFVSKLGHIITNQHVINQCQRVTVGENSNRQVAVNVLETDRLNDLALLRIAKMTTTSAETKSLISKLGIAVVPLATHGLLRLAEVELGERVMVAGYPYGDIFSNTIKVTGGMISSNRGAGDDSGQFQIDAAVQPGNSGGPIYDAHGNIVGVVVAQLNKLKMAKLIGSLPENVNFGIKASTVRQFLNASGLPTKWSKRSKAMSTKNLAKIAMHQTVMVVCHR